PTSLRLFRKPYRLYFPRIARRTPESFVLGPGPPNAGEIPHQVIFTRGLERFNNQRPTSFEKRTVPVDPENWIPHWEKIFDVMGCDDAFKTSRIFFSCRIRQDITVFFTKRGVTIMISEPGFETVCSKYLTCEMVNTRTDAELSAAVQNALQTLLPQIRTKIRKEFRTSSGPSNSGGNPPSVTIHTWLERFNKQKPRSFEKATALVDAENWISHMEKIFDVMGCEDAFKTRLAVYKFEGNVLAWWKAYKQAKGGDTWLITVTWAEFKKLFFLQFFPLAEQERLKREYHFIRQTNTETSTEFMQRFLRLAGSTLNHLMCMSFTDVAQVANAARNYEILHERDDDDAERPDKRQKSGDRHQPTTQQRSHMNHGHNNDRHGSDRRGGGDNHRSNNNYSG
nr:hypothetical protein [Tanacetum cinerariifolium]